MKAFLTINEETLTLNQILDLGAENIIEYATDKWNDFIASFQAKDEEHNNWIEEENAIGSECFEVYLEVVDGEEVKEKLSFCDLDFDGNKNFQGYLKSL